MAAEVAGTKQSLRESQSVSTTMFALAGRDVLMQTLYSFQETANGAEQILLIHRNAAKLTEWRTRAMSYTYRPDRIVASGGQPKEDESKTYSYCCQSSASCGKLCHPEFPKTAPSLFIVPCLSCACLGSIFKKLQLPEVYGRLGTIETKSTIHRRQNNKCSTLYFSSFPPDGSL